MYIILRYIKNKKTFHWIKLVKSFKPSGGGAHL